MKLPEGIDEYATSDGVLVSRIHYSSDPAKNQNTLEGMRWFKSAIKGWRGGIEGSDWQQEMEMNFRITSGKRVFPRWDIDVQPKIAYDPEEVEIQEHWPIKCGFDYGQENPTVLTANAFAASDLAYQIDEIVMRGTSPTAFAQEAKRRPWFERVTDIVGDPSIWRSIPKPGSMQMTSIGEMFADEGIHIQQGRNEEGVDMAFVALLTGNLWLDLEKPKWLISIDCKNTLKSFRNLRRIQNPKTPHASERPESEKLVQKGVDEFDACKYLLLSLGLEDPEEIEILPNTFDWWVKQSEQRYSTRKAILG